MPGVLFAPELEGYLYNTFMLLHYTKAENIEILMHSAESSKYCQITLYNFSLVKYNTPIKTAPVIGVMEREENYEKVNCIIIGSGAGSILHDRMSSQQG